MSVGTSTIRAVILVVAVVLGTMMIGQAFGSGTGLALRSTSPSPSVTTSPPSSPSPSVTTKPALTRRTAVRGVAIQVLNGSTVDGLGGVVAHRLAAEGYAICDTCVQTAAVQDVTSTIIYYAKGAKELAGYMQQHYLQGAQLKPAKSLFSAHVKLTVLVGTDQSH